MLLQGDLTSNKTDIIIEKYAQLLNSGVKSSEILVLLQNKNKRQLFEEKTLKKLTLDAVEKFQIHSFQGLVYNTILNNWATIENSISNISNTQILPNLAGLQISQYIMRNILNKVEFKGYNSRKSLLHQMFRRYSLIVQNNLSPQDVKWRSEDVLKESFAPDAKFALDEFKKETLNLRCLDYLRQTLIFNFIYKNTDYFKNINYLLLDDGDEITPVCYDFIEYLKPQLKDWIIAYDKLGSTRVGYLSADKTAPNEFEKLFQDSPTILTSPSKLQSDAQTLFSNVLNNSNDKLSSFVFSSYLTRGEMLKLEQVKALLKQGIKPCEIVIISPIIDSTLNFCINENLSKLCTPVSICGNEKLVNDSIVAFCLNVLKCAEETDYDLRKIFHFLKIPARYADKNLPHVEYQEKYQKFLQVVEELKSIELLSRQVIKIYEELIDKNANTIKLGFFIKQIEEFESINVPKSEIIQQLENSIISENPIENITLGENDLIIATPQKVIDNQIKSKYQFWLDVSSDEWVKNDTGPLYNSWVMQKSWNKDEYTLQDNVKLSRQKTARILRKLTLCATEKIYTYSSLYDTTGIENFGGIEKYVKSSSEQAEINEKRTFTPRDDQRAVLEYTKGQMAVSAVPGAGKTTILLELIIRLLQSGKTPEKIFVMTYMESAARTLKERIKKAAPNLINLPNISTIHGLALRILKENNNFERIGLNSDFDICDDSKKAQILSGVIKSLGLKKMEAELFEKAISVTKMSNVTEFPPVNDEKLDKFIRFFNSYCAILKENNLIDYDDMLLSCVKLLKENSDILEYYQNLCEYLIEDEAQDSSKIQQELITLLSAKSKNLIRCGDVNQAITATFSNSDVEGFKHFINSSEQAVSMNCSQRCCEKVWKLANHLLETFKKSFYEIYMHPVEGRNPVEKNALIPMILQDKNAERGFVLKEIKSLLKQNPDATIGILLRSNFQVNNWTNFIENCGIKTIVRNECLDQKPFFKTILAVLRVIANPFNNDILAESYAILSEQGFYKSGYFEKIKAFEKPFIQANLDELYTPDMTMFLWDMIYWLNFPNLSFDELATKIGLYYYTSELDKSNIHVISAFIKRLNMQNLESLVARLTELSKKMSVSGVKFFSEEENSSLVTGKVQVMTIHKSKGDEFDYVFMPEMTKNNLPITLESVSLRKDASFMESVRAFSKTYKVKSETELKTQILEENLKLLYVAITRAKKKLYISVAENEKNSEPNDIFEIMEALL